MEVETDKVGYFVLLGTELTLLLADTRYGVCNVNLHKAFKKTRDILGKNNPYTSEEERVLGKRINWDMDTHCKKRFTAGDY